MNPNATIQPRQNSALDDREMQEKLHQPIARAALDDARRNLVKDNIGLVYVHLKNHVTPHRIPWTQREWQDLVQEGCLGLIRAAQDFNPNGKIPFAAFALPRIHTAIRGAMLKRFGTGVAFAGGDSPAKRSFFGNEAAKPDWSPRKRRRDTSDLCPLDALGDWWGSNNDTLGVRMREKYERTVHRAVARVVQQAEADAADGDIVRALAADRHLVPDSHARKPYREVANRVGAPYSRVIQYDRQLCLAIRRELNGDPEFAELQRLARTEDRGVDTPADDRLDQHLARLSSAEILQRLLDTSGVVREKIIRKFFEVAAQSLFQSIRRELESLPVSAREVLLSESSPVCIDGLEACDSVIPGREADPKSKSNVSVESRLRDLPATQVSNLVGGTVSG